MKPVNIILLILVIIIAISIIGFTLSLVGALVGFVWRFIFSPLGVIALIILVIYLLKKKKK